MAIPFIWNIPSKIPLVRVIRNPFDVVRSVLNSGFLMRQQRRHFEHFVATYRPFIVESDDPLVRAIRYTTLWDKALDGVPCWVVRPDLDYPEMAKKHTSPHTYPLSVEDILLHSEGWRLAARAEQWGYL